MSTLDNSQNVWSPLPGESHKMKYEKCRNITEEIYKRINITFEIKKLEMSNTQSDLSDCSDIIDSNDLSNETDLFACDKSDITSSTDPENLDKTDKYVKTCEKYININNNNEEKMKKSGGSTVSKRPRKRFRKRVKKNQARGKASDTEGSSDEATPPGRVVELDTQRPGAEGGGHSGSGSPDVVMGVPNILIVTKDFKSKAYAVDKKISKENSQSIKSKVTDNGKMSGTTTPTDATTDKVLIGSEQSLDNAGAAIVDLSMAKEEKVSNLEWKCTLCSLSFKGERGLRRHTTMSHIITAEEPNKLTKLAHRGTRPA